MIQMANSVTQVEEAGTVFITHTVLLRNSKVIKKTTRLQPVYYLNGLNICLLSMVEFLNDEQLIFGNNHQVIFLRKNYLFSHVNHMLLARQPFGLTRPLSQLCHCLPKPEWSMLLITAFGTNGWVTLVMTFSENYLRW